MNRRIQSEKAAKEISIEQSADALASILKAETETLGKAQREELRFSMARDLSEMADNYRLSMLESFVHGDRHNAIKLEALWVNAKNLEAFLLKGIAEPLERIVDAPMRKAARRKAIWRFLGFFGIKRKVVKEITAEAKAEVANLVQLAKEGAAGNA